jgi:hypothetical protein
MSAGLGSIYKRGGVYWISWYYRGERYRESSKSTKKKDAEDLLRKRIRDVGKGRPAGLSLLASMPHPFSRACPTPLGALGEYWYLGSVLASSSVFGVRVGC